VPEALARLEHFDHLLLVHELGRAFVGHVEELRRRAVLDEHVGPRGIGVGLGCGNDARQVGVVERVERRIAAEEGGWISHSLQSIRVGTD
jgi:hypothetical protein